MKQLQYRKHGTTDVLSWQNVAVPVPGPGEVLVHVRATSINPTDAKIRTGELGFMAILRPRPLGMGMDVAGTVEAVGAGVTGFAIGDRVLGSPKNGNAFADATIVKAKALSLLPLDVDFAHGACLPIAGATGYAVAQALKPAPGKSILLNGAAGAIGLVALQLCVQAGADVTATGSAASLPLLSELGASAAIDYRTLDVATLAGRFDTILDLSGALLFARAKPMLKARGRYATMTPSLSSMVGQLGTLFAGRKSTAMFAVGGAPAVKSLLALFAAGKLVIQVGATRPLADAIATQAEVESGALKPVGKVVLVA